jgi:hypothetical protein
MKNLNHYYDDAFDFHKEVLESKNVTKKDPTYKIRVENLGVKIKKQFDIYDDNFTCNTLEGISSHEYTNSEKEDLLKLYSYKNSVIQKLKVHITTTATKRIISTCPNCTISEVNSFDHYLPKEKFPEFVVNPKNLFPSCTVCNGYKNDIWVEKDKRLFLNLYLDLLPEEQYLFVDLAIDKDVVSASFFLQNKGCIEPAIFDTIMTHYSRLHLLKRFNENINEVITSLENTIKAFLSELALDKIIPIIIEKSNKDKLAFGHNYWKSILEIALMNNAEYMNRFISIEE